MGRPWTSRTASTSSLTTPGSGDTYRGWWRQLSRRWCRSRRKMLKIREVDFFRPTAKPGDYPYFVRRTFNHMYPVYVHGVSNMYTKGGGAQATVVTWVKKVEGDMEQLRLDLSEFLFQRYEAEFISQTDEVRQKVVFRGNFDTDFKDFLKMRGF